MKVYEISRGKGIEALTLTERPDLEPLCGQVLIRVRATSLNYRDLIVAQNYAGKPPALIPMSDGAGDVVAVGAGVTEVKVGDRVAGIFFQKWLSGGITKETMKSDLGGSIDGMLAEYALLDASGVVILPDCLSYIEGATLPCAAVTAWHAMVTKGNIKAGETVLLLGTGGVSIFALQFAKMHGARAIVTSSSDEKLERAKVLGADATINYKAFPNWEEKVYKLTDGLGVDSVVEVGGAGTLEQSIKSVRYGGRISLIGVLSGFTGTINPQYLLFKSVTLQGIYVGSREMFSDMNLAIALNRLKPIVDRSFSFDEANAAYRYMQSGSHFGKIAIEI